MRNNTGLLFFLLFGNLTAQDFYASVSDLSKLLQTEEQLINSLEKYVEAQREKLLQMQQ